jgi:polyhydroxybutyrate depolymerase
MRAARKRKLVHAAKVGLVFLAACSPSTKKSTYELREFGRAYSVVARVDHDPKRAAPVVISLHAYATETGVLESKLELAEVAVRDRGYLLVVPRGTSDSKGAPFWNATRACCDAERREPNDIGYLVAVLSDVRKRYAVDPKRVIAIGLSNGGFMAYRWACTPGSDLSGIISISGAGLDASDPSCAPSRPVSVLGVHGDDDDVVRFGGGVMNGASHPSAEASVAALATRDGCAKVPTPTPVAGAGLVLRGVHWKCPSAAAGLWVVPGGGHRLAVGARLLERALDFVD